MLTILYMILLALGHISLNGNFFCTAPYEKFILYFFKCYLLKNLIAFLKICVLILQCIIYICDQYLGTKTVITVFGHTIPKNTLYLHYIREKTYFIKYLNSANLLQGVMFISLKKNSMSVKFRKLFIDEKEPQNNLMIICLSQIQWLMGP